MTYQVLARKWRPQAFNAVVGQDAIVRTLKNALASSRIAHAYLFAGPRGIGKTTTARLLARALLCAARTSPEPCAACEACLDTASVDVIEIDGASNRGIEEIRTLRENVKYAPSRGRFKVYIIDEVHQLTEAAFNALLKTLEEPPPHVVFILATTDPRDIPPTVLSRVQRFDFRPIAPETLLTSLEQILTEEQVPFDPGALPPVVRAAEGSLRDALSLLDTAIAYGDGRLDADATATLLGAITPEEVRAFGVALVGHDAAGALAAIDRAAADGKDLKAFVRDVIELFRRALVLKAAPTTKLADLTHAEGNELRELGEATSLDELLYIVRAFLDADEEMRESPHPRVELEVATVRATRRPVPEAIDELLRRIDEAESRLRAQGFGAAAPVAEARTQTSLLESEPAVGPRRSGWDATGAGRTAPRGAASSGAPPPSGSLAVEPLASGSPGSRSAVPSVAGTEPRAAAASVPGSPPAPAGDLATAWTHVVADVMKRKPMLSAVLGHARPVMVADGALRLALTGNHFHRDMLADRAAREIVTEAVRRWVEGAERFDVVSGAEADTGPITHPVVQATIAEFQGEVVAVRARSPEGDGS